MVSTKCGRGQGMSTGSGVCSSVCSAAAFRGSFCANSFQCWSPASDISYGAWLNARGPPGRAAQQGSAVLCTGDLRWRAWHAVPSFAQDDGTHSQFRPCGLLLDRQAFWALRRVCGQLRPCGLLSGKAGVLDVTCRCVFRACGHLPVCLPGMRAGTEAPWAWTLRRPAVARPRCRP